MVFCVFLSGRRVMDKLSLASTKATAMDSGTQPKLPRHGQATASRAARAGAATPVASIRSDLRRKDTAGWFPLLVGRPTVY